jgi:LuxR family maltose regulon positive regulatory protein
VWSSGRAPSYAQVATLLVRALVERQRGNFVLAHSALERGLDIVVAEGLRRSLDVGDPQVRALLAEHAAWGSRHEVFLAEVLAAPTVGTPTAADLSRREKEILAYLRTTMSVADIAAKLHVSVNTVKTHQKSIYRKLGVSSRREAVAYRL